MNWAYIKYCQILRHEDTGEAFIREVLGELIDYDEKENTDYLDILKAFFENECSIVHTAQAMYCHKNTMNYKMNKVKEILGVRYNEQRESYEDYGGIVFYENARIGGYYE